NSGLFSAIKYDENVQAILGWLIKALIELNAPSSIAGVNTFAKKVFGVNLIISYPSEYLACGKYEAAKQSLFLFAEAGGLNEFEKEFFLELIRSKKFKIYENRDVNSTIEKTLQLLGASNIHDETDKFEITSLPWEIEKRIDDFERKFMDILSQMEKSKKGQKYGKIDALLKKPFEEMIKKISFEIQRYSFIMNSVDICPKIKVKFSLLDALKRAISLKLNDGGYKNG
uniref:Uncharacterized protein n=1 Tax=Panagrolaimus sp. JU765 TaxID=591449 RepID=A0AC34RPJ8_9BILA